MAQSELVWRLRHVPSYFCYPLIVLLLLQEDHKPTNTTSTQHWKKSDFQKLLRIQKVQDFIFGLSTSLEDLTEPGERQRWRVSPTQ